MVLVRQAERPYTAADLASVPDDGRRYEVIQGEMIVSPSPSERHQRIVTELLGQLQSYLKSTGLGGVYPAPLDVFLDPYNVVQPDILVVLKEHQHRIKQDGIHGAPDLVVEVISPGSRGNDRVRKAAAYAAAGVQEYWLVDPEDQSILVQYLVNQQYEVVPAGNSGPVSRLLKGLSLDANEVFAIPDWLTEIER